MSDKRVTADEVARLATSRRELPAELPLRDLSPHDLFMCNLGAHRNYLYRFHSSVYVDGKLDHCLAMEVGRLGDDGHWGFRIGRNEPSNWNPYAHVFRVRLIPYPEE